MQQANQHISQVHKKLGTSPFILWFLGLLVLFLWTAGTVVQIQTSEYLALGSSSRVAGVAWGVFLQPWLILTGTAPIQQVLAWLYAWVVEAVTLVFAICLGIAVAKLQAVNRHIARWFVILGSLLILLNGWADYSSSPGVNPLVQALIALAIGGIVVVGLPLAVGLLEHGCEEW